MGSTSGASSGLRNSSSDDDLMDQRKRKRMISNRESARRSRMKKQKHLDDLMSQVIQLRKENNEILAGMSITSQLYMKIEAENSILRAQMAELKQRLESLNEITHYMNHSTSALVEAHDDEDSQQIDYDYFGMNNNPWSSFHVSQQPMMDMVMN